MLLYFLRHGEADWPDWDKPDDERPLTRRGRREMKRVARFLKRLKFHPEVILSSPLPRASETAEIAAKRFNREVQIDPELADGFNLGRLRRILRDAPAESIMLVGHDPEFSAVIKELTGGEVKLAKGGIALMETDDDCSSGKLLWLLPPKIAARRTK